ncbi:hypothetical protein [Stappia indica]|uniref:hypothetical protein n=1 Tax=Stappia indica TaxID=538381 RepID=UPI001CD6A61C|nr:hypothetical protein [Stappia indica]MCA1298036.1 hypothetical protein [Stappia indica]
MTPFAAYAPDQPGFYSAGSPLIRNVIPTQSGYRPFPALAALSSALPAQPQGFFFNVEVDNTVTIFAATADKLYKLDATDYSWDDVSRSSGAYTGNSTQGWTFARFGDQVLATNGNDDVQSFIVGTSTKFADLAGSPPKARRVAVVGDHVVLYGLTDNPNRIQWSGTNDATEWTPLKNNADYQDFPEGGEIMFVAAVERNAIVLQRFKARAMTATGESGFVFTFAEIESRGAVSHRACTAHGGRVFFLSEDGFFVMTPGAGSQPIGAERVDATFKAAVTSVENLEIVTAAADPINKMIVWAYSTNGTTLDRAIGYAWQVDRWVDLELGTLFGLSAGATSGYTLEALAVEYPNLDAMTISLDSPRWLGGRPAFAGFDASYRLGFFDGANLEATLDTADMSFSEGRKARIRAFRPITDATAIYGQIGNKSRWNGPTAWGLERLASSQTGRVIVNQSGFTHRIRCRIPSGADWTGIAGVEAIESTVQGLK